MAQGQKPSPEKVLGLCEGTRAALAETESSQEQRHRPRHHPAVEAKYLSQARVDKWGWDSTCGKLSKMTESGGVTDGGPSFPSGSLFFFLLHYEEFLVISVWIFTSDIIEK